VQSSLAMRGLFCSSDLLVFPKPGINSLLVVHCGAGEFRTLRIGSAYGDSAALAVSRDDVKQLKKVSRNVESQEDGLISSFGNRNGEENVNSSPVSGARNTIQ
jgi:hypothetical protein